MTIQIEESLHFGGLKGLFPNEIMCLVAESNYTILHLSNGRKIIFSYHLAKIHSIISRQNSSFIRVNRSTVINLNYVTYFNYDYLTLGDRKITFSRRRRDIIKNEINKYLISNSLKS
jgi:DNA-binding LytR/AlgR family response regulator